MSEFVESEAEESEDEEIRTKKRKNPFQEEDDEEEEEDDEEKLREEMKDLINDDEEEEEEGDEEDGEGEDSDNSSRKKKKRREDYDDGLEEDDYDLIEENLGVKVERKKKFKRVKRIEDDESEGEEEDVGNEREAIANDLFEEGSDQEERVPVEKPIEEDQFQDVSGSEMESDPDDFIVDDKGQPISQGRKKRHIRYHDSALQEAQDIFGVEFDFQDFDKYRDEYEEEIEEYEDDDEGETRPRPKKSARKKTTRKSIFDVFEPSELKKGHLTDEDNKIKTTDSPERFQLRTVPVTEAEDDEINDEAQWIFKYAFTDLTLSNQSAAIGEYSDSRKPIAGLKQISALQKIRDALKFMRNQKLEVPFIAFYRKEYVEPDLNINDLWAVFKWDEKWCQLKTRKGNLSRLFKRMQDFQCDVIMKEPDKPLADNMRIIKDTDMEKIEKIETPEELRDAYLLFMLYFAKDIPAMQEAAAVAAAIEKKRMRAAKAAALLNRKQPTEEGENGEERVVESQPVDEDEPEVELTKVKKAVRKDIYLICQDNGVDGMARKFGLTPEQFSENLRDNYQRHEVEQYPVSPDDLAGDYISKRFPTSEEVLKAAKLMVAMEISRDIIIRKCIRQVYFDRAKLSACPTKKGMKEIDENHNCYSMKYLKNKPIKDLVGDQFLRLQQCEKDGLMTLRFGMGKHIDDNGYLDEIKPLYEKDEFSQNVLEWNRVRNQALEMALQKYLFPTFEKELRLRLIQESKEGILKACCRKLYNWLKVAPYQIDQQIEEDDDYDTREGIRVLSMAFVPDRSVPAFCAMVDGSGEVTEFLRLRFILFKRNAWKEEERQLKEQDMQALKRFILAKKPHVIVIGGESREANQIIEDVKTVVSDLAESDQLPIINVELLDNELSTIYMNSKRAENDFRDYPQLLRQAISLARRMQDPLVEFSQLCTHEEEIICLKYHPMQDQISNEDLLNALYLEFVNRTNEVGVDINQCISHPHSANLLQFVCGLGPRKANQLLRILKQNHQRLESRTQLVTFCKMGPQVFINCAGFVKIDTSSLGDSDAYVEVLDGSRVHPEAYEWARKMAVDALEYDDMAEDVNPAGALEEILENPEKLKDLDLDAFAEELERQGYGNKSITLYDIRAELNHRYKDLRSAFRPPNPEETFNMLTKETPETFYIGKMVLARVVGIARKKPQGEQLDQANPIRIDETGLWQCPFCLKSDFPELSEVWNHFDAGSCLGQAMGVRCYLDNGVSGFIPTKNISDKRVTNPEERVRLGMTINSRITKIIIEKFSVDLTSRSSDLADKNNEFKPPRDLYYDCEGEDKERKMEEDLKKRQNRQTYVKRVIVHPSFHNIGYKEAEVALAKMDQGDVIIRPSSKGVDHLTVTWKVHDGILQHIDIREEGKEKPFSLGHTLLIGTEEFEDLDEIIARHIQPMAGYARDLINFKYFRDGDGGKKDVMDKIVSDDKKKAPSKIPYFVSASKEFPGKFMLSYLPRNKPRHEFITVSPEGFRYRQRNFHSTNSLFKWFKEHFRDPIPGTPASTIARTPAGRNSAYIGATPSINLSNVDAQAIQLAAANLPNHVFNTLSQVAGQTPAAFSGSNYHGHGASFSGANNSFSYQPYTPSQPIATPIYQSLNTPGQPMVATPRYSQTPQTNWVHPSQTPRQTPRQIPTTPRQMPTTPRPSSRPPSRQSTPASMSHHQTKPSKSKTPTETDWKRIAEQWVRNKQAEVANTSSSSNREEPTVAGDSTPLIDEH